MRVETKFGQSVCIVGSIKELGEWNEFKFHCEWTEDHHWVTKQPIITQSPFFRYKYVLLEDGNLKGWERGIDRIAQLTILPELPKFEVADSEGPLPEGVRCVQIRD